MLLPALRGDKYKNDLVLVYGGAGSCIEGELFCFCLTSNMFEGRKLYLKKKKVSFQWKKKTTGLAISTVAQIQTAKTKHTEHLKECVYLGIITSYSGTPNSLCF